MQIDNRTLSSSGAVQRMPALRWCVLAALASLLPLTGHAAGDTAAATRSIADLSIEELMNVEVVSVSRKAQRLTDAAAAVYVISNEDIRRSGSRNLPEALRLAPGVDVAEIGAGAYAIGIRGFAARFANKLLVLQDGRTLYTDLFSGVFWERQMPLLDDVERIEVIRGPGAAAWGSNAVNGVINIITRSSRDTQGGLAVAALGTDHYREGALRQGARLDAVTTVRAFVRGAGANSGVGSPAASAGVAADNASAGLRLDRQLAAGTLSVDAQVYRAANQQAIAEPIPSAPYTTSANTEQKHTGTFVLAHWDQRLDQDSALAVQAYYDEARLDFPGYAGETHTIVDVDGQISQRLGTRHEVSVGLGLRSDHNGSEDSQYLHLINPVRGARLLTLRLQDDITLVAERLHLTAGALIEDHSEFGNHVMPDVRLAWTPSATTTTWTAVSRAIRLPGRFEREISTLNGQTIPANGVQLPLPLVPVVQGTPGFGIEDETSWQIGTRFQPDRDVSVDLAGYVSRYRSLRSVAANPAGIQPALFGSVPYLVLPVLLVNGPDALTHGVEAAVDWHASAWWRLQLSVTHMTVSIDPSRDTSDDAGHAPSDLVSLRSSMDLGPVRSDLWLRHVSKRLLPNTAATVIPAYDALDLRLAWDPLQNLELALTGKNLLQRRHLEDVAGQLNSVTLDVDRSAMVTARIGF